MLVHDTLYPKECHYDYITAILAISRSPPNGYYCGHYYGYYSVLPAISRPPPMGTIVGTTMGTTVYSRRDMCHVSQSTTLLLVSYPSRWSVIYIWISVMIIYDIYFSIQATEKYSNSKVLHLSTPRSALKATFFQYLAISGVSKFPADWGTYFDSTKCWQVRGSNLRVYFMVSKHTGVVTPVVFFRGS